MEDQLSQSPNPQAIRNSARTGTPVIGNSQLQNLFWANSLPLDDQPIPDEDSEPMWQRFRSDVNVLGATHQVDIDGPRLDQMSFLSLTSGHPLGQTVDFPFSQGDNVLLNNPNLSLDMFNEPLPYASPRELECMQDLSQIVEVREQIRCQEIQMFMNNQIHANGSGSDQNSFSPPTIDHPSEQSVDYSSTQGDNGPFDDPNFSLPLVLPQESEHVSDVYPVFAYQEQLGQPVETSLQLGPEIQMFHLHAQASRPDQYIIMATTYSNSVLIILQLKKKTSRSVTPNLALDRFDSPFPQVPPQESGVDKTSYRPPTLRRSHRAKARRITKHTNPGRHDQISRGVAELGRRDYEPERGGHAESASDDAQHSGCPRITCCNFARAVRGTVLPDRGIAGSQILVYACCAYSAIALREYSIPSAACMRDFFQRIQNVAFVGRDSIERRGGGTGADYLSNPNRARSLKRRRH
ncbi:hypothetical protein BC827DRAFT_1152922 [Russula dissimulans]|nr:hypothetical protein BC827DRAFT_1152922 [Russula dissimulans]